MRTQVDNVKKLENIAPGLALNLVTQYIMPTLAATSGHPPHTHLPGNFLNISLNRFING